MLFHGDFHYIDVLSDKDQRVYQSFNANQKEKFQDLQQINNSLFKNLTKSIAIVIDDRAMYIQKVWKYFKLQKVGVK